MLPLPSTLTALAAVFCRTSATFGQDGGGGVFPAAEDSVSQQTEGAGLPKEFKEKRSFDDILWNTFIVIMVIFLGYALLLPRIRHVVERIQGKKSAVVAKAAPAQGASGGTGQPVPAAQPPDTSRAPAPSSTAEEDSPSASTTSPPIPARSSAATPPPVSTEPHVIVNPPSKTASLASKLAPKPKSSPAAKPPTTSKPLVQAASFQARYAVDAGSYQVRSNAEGLVSHLPRKYQPQATLTPVRVRGTLFYRVRVVVATKADADALSAHLLQTEKVHAVILPLR